MTPRIRVLLGGLLAVGTTALLAGLSRAPQRTSGTETGALRLAWRAQPERIEVCRPVPEAELANLPRHMRQTVLCDGRSAEYRLTVVSDGVLLADDTVHGGGARRDRPMYLYREYTLEPGPHDLTIRLERIGEAGPVAAADSAPATESQPRTATRLVALPAALQLARRVLIPPRGVVLVTYDQDRQELVVR